MQKNTVNIIISSLAGLIVGAVAALLLAPMEGSETRRRIKERASTTGGKMKDTSAMMRDKVQEGRRRASEQVSKARQAIASRTKEAAESTQEAAAQVQTMAEEAE